MRRALLLLLVSIFCMTGCVDEILDLLADDTTTTTGSSTSTKTTNIDFDYKALYSDEVLEVSLQPEYYNNLGYYKGFVLKVKNISKKDIQLSWNNSYYIINKQAYGGFMYTGIRYMDKDSPKPDSLIFPDSTLSVNIYPSIGVSFWGGEWRQDILPPFSDSIGAYLYFFGDGYSKKVKLVGPVE